MVIKAPVTKFFNHTNLNFLILEAEPETISEIQPQSIFTKYSQKRETVTRENITGVEKAT